MQIEIQDLHKSFGKEDVHRGVDLKIKSGELCVVMGGSGSGKSVLIKQIVGLLKPDKGKILIDDQDVVPMNEREMGPIRRRFGMIFQTGGMLQSLNVAQNVGLPLVEVNGMKEPEALEIVKEKLKLVGIEGMEDKPISSLSGGQRKRAAIARALVQDADCMIFDEPTAGLDPPISKTIDEVIMDMNKKAECTTIVVTHDLISAFTIADRIYFLHKGRIAAQGTKDEIKNSDEEVVQSFLAREFPNL